MTLAASTTSTIFSATADAQEAGRSTRPAPDLNELETLPLYLIAQLPRTRWSDLDAASSFQAWVYDAVVVRGPETVSARVIRSSRDEEFDLNLIPDDRLLK